MAEGLEYFIAEVGEVKKWVFVLRPRHVDVLRSTQKQINVIGQHIYLIGIRPNPNSASRKLSKRSYVSFTSCKTKHKTVVHVNIEDLAELSDRRVFIAPYTLILAEPMETDRAALERLYKEAEVVI